MMITRMALPRRTFLRGVGATLALPLLDAMVPALAALAKTPAQPASRLGFIYVPNGAVMNKWTPAQEGRAFELSPTLAPLEPFRDQTLVVSGLAQLQANSFDDGAGDHSRGTAAWLSGLHAKRTEGADVQLGVTADQIAAKEFGRFTQLASLELALETIDLVGNCATTTACWIQCCATSGACSERSDRRTTIGSANTSNRFATSSVGSSAPRNRTRSPSCRYSTPQPAFPTPSRLTFR
jgi:hypothetical protein